jgi:Lar family restriction alleviation protein
MTHITKDKGEARKAEVPETEALKPCPFCGHVGISVCEGSTFRWRYAMCDNCGAQAGEVRHNTLADDQAAATKESHAEAIKEWNTRAAELSAQDASPKDAPFQDAWYEIAYLLGIGAQNASPKEVHDNQVMPRLRALREMEAASPKDVSSAQSK